MPKGQRWKPREVNRRFLHMEDTGERQGFFIIVQNIFYSYIIKSFLRKIYDILSVPTRKAGVIPEGKMGFL